MKLNWDFSKLHTAIQALGAKSVSFALDRASHIDDIEELLIKGVSIDLNQISSKSSLLMYKERQILLYIPDQGTNIENVLRGDSVTGKKFHVSNCITLIEMRQNNRLERYIATTDTTGKFDVHGIDCHKKPMNGRASLYVCINCLKKLNYKQAKIKSFIEVRNNFNLSDFFNTYASCFSFMPKRTTIDVNSSTYTTDWPGISRRIRADAQWVCQSCHIDLSKHHHLLQTHHLDGVKNNNKNSNLKALCINCHRMQPLHQHMIIPLEDTRTINFLRIQQGLMQQNWNSVMNYTDSALHGIIGVLQANRWPVPQLEFSPPGLGAEVELAWPDSFYAISLRDLDTSKVSGWTIDTLDAASQRYL